MKRLLLALALFAAAAPALAEPLFVEDFEDGDAHGWSPSGGDARLTQYAGNTSLRLSGRTAVIARASTRGRTGVTVAAAMAASSLESDEHCLVEVSADGGETWLQVLRVGDGQDDAVTLHRAALTDARLDDAETVLIGARASGGQSDDQCWLDNVRVIGAQAETQAAPRTALAAAELHATVASAALAPMNAFAASADARQASNSFNGVLRFDGRMSGFDVLRDDFHVDREASLRVRELPRFEVELFQHDGLIDPIVRGPVASGHPNWDYAIGAGRVWDEPGDGGLSRAALPFALIETNANCTHNGVVTFLFNDSGAVSNVAWQIASETCAYLQFNAWGVAAAQYDRTRRFTAADIASHTAQRASEMPVRPLSELAHAHPGVDISLFASPADIDPRALTTYGVVYQGVHYLGGCDTRAGPYPFCDQLLLPSYSLAKSIVGGLGLMRLELLRPGSMDERISAHVPECADWGDVTFGNALDMATGRYRSAEDQADENALTSSRFFLSTTHAEKERIACRLYPRREAPGARWTYHTPDTYVLGAAMADLWRDEHGPNADFFNDVLRDGVFRPLQLSPEIAATRRTLDAVGQPFTGWGLTLTRDDVAKLTAYLNTRAHQAPLVDPHQLDAAMQRDPNDRGLTAGSETLRYNNGFWAYNAQGPLNCPAPVWIPFFSGFGGNIVAMMPNGVTYYYFSDGYDFLWARAAVAADAIAPLCPRGQQ